MIGTIKLVLAAVLSRLRRRARLEAENVALRHQLNILKRSAPRRVPLTNLDRWLLVWLYWLCPSVLDAIRLVRPETVVRWHRQGFRAYWRWRSQRAPGRPKMDRQVRDLIRQISMANPLWGARRTRRIASRTLGHSRWSQTSSTRSTFDSCKRRGAERLRMLT